MTQNFIRKLKMEKKLSVFSSGLIWFGAALSIAEILTGTYFAPLGLGKGLLAIIIGHVIGSALLFGAGYIGAVSGKSAMETTKYSFGNLGAKFFALLNVLQLVGWTGIMIYDGALSVNEIFKFGDGNISAKIWACVIGVLILVWIFIGITNLGKVNTVTMTALFILTLVLSKIIFFSKNGIAQISASAEEAMSFGAAIELAVAMPLSWLPLISDYTKDAEKPFAASLTSALVYCVVSIWMYVIGMGAAIFTGESGIATIMAKSGLGIAGLIIIVFSTVTTTFMDAYSGGVSSETVSKKINGKWAAIIITIIGTLGAVFIPMDDITNFLYLIGSVFAPMIAILLADFFVVKNDSTENKIDIMKAVIWIIGFVLYRILMRFDIPVGNTLVDMAVTFAITVLAGKLIRHKNTEE